MRTYSYGGNKEDTINHFWTNTGCPRQTGHCGDKRRFLKDPSSSTSKLTSPVLSIATHPVAKHFLDVMSVVFVNKRLLVMGIWTCLEENDWCQIEKPLKMWPFPCSLDPSTLSDLRSRLQGITAVHVSRFGERGEKSVRLGAVRSEPHTHTPPAVHHKPPASRLIWTWWCGAQIYDILCMNLFCLTSLFSNFLSASGSNLLFTWQEHQTLMHRFAAAELPLRTCFFCVYSFQCPFSVA